MNKKFKLFEDIKILTEQYKTDVNVFLMNKKQLEKNMKIEHELILALEKLMNTAAKNIIILKHNRKNSLSALKELKKE